MLRFISSTAIYGLILAALIVGGSLTAQAQCQNGMCPLAAQSAPVASFPANSRPTASSPVAETIVDDGTLGSVAPPIIENTSNIVGYSSNFVMPSTVGCRCAGYSSCCCSGQSYYYPTVQSWSVPLNSYYPTSTYYPATSSCSGGTCRVR